jgi:hypothetical protein
MPLDTRIPLAAVAPKIDFDPTAGYVKIAQLQHYAQQGQLTGLKLQEAQREQQDDVALRDVWARYKDQDLTQAPTQQKFLGDVGAAAGPKAYATLGKLFGEQAKTMQDLKNAKLETEKREVELALKMLEHSTDDTTWKANRALAVQRHGPEATAGLPEAYDPQALLTMQQRLEARHKDLTHQLGVRTADQRDAQLDETRRGHDLTAQTTREGHAVTREGHGVTREGHAVTRDSTKATVGLEKLQLDLAEAQRKAGGAELNPTERTNLLLKVRSDIRTEPVYQTFATARTAYGNVQEGVQRNDGVGDLAVGYGLASLLDPRPSVVREQEFSNIENAQGALQKLLNSPDKFFEGDRLKPEYRQKFLALATQLYAKRQANARDELGSVYGGILKPMNARLEDVLPGLEPPGSAGGTPIPGPGPAQAGTPAPGADLLEKYRSTP